MTAITHLSDGGFIWIIAAAVMLMMPKYRRYGAVLGIVLISGAVLNSFVLKPFFDRARPFEGIADISLLIPTPQDASFPSGHTLASISSSAVIFAANRRVGTCAMILALLTAWSRMYLYVHFPTDIIAGAVLAIALAAFWLWIFKARKKEL